jgi:glycosyltransferase involved in cell wall biosynthesis
MRICLVSQEYPPESARGGIGTQTWTKAHALTRLGHRVHVLSVAASPGPPLRTETVEEIVVHRLQPPGFDVPVHELQTYWVGYSWQVLRALHVLLRDGLTFDLINFPEYGAEGFAFQLDRHAWCRTPVVVQLHGPLAMFAKRIGWPSMDTEFWRVGTFMESYSIGDADGWTASSHNIAAFAAEEYGLPLDAIDVVHCGLDADMFSPPDRRAPLPERPTVLFVGNVASNKGIEVVFAAVLRLRARYPNILLRVLGQADDDLIASLERTARQQGAGSSVEFLGFVNDRAKLPDFYRRAHVFASPAYHEVGIANVYIEAMACGCPVIASASGGAPEAVIDGETGVLVPPRDVSGTAAAIDQLLGNPSLRLKMSAAGRHRVEEYFTVDRYIGRVLAAYERTIQRVRERAAIGRSAEWAQPTP